jgi:putative Mg2+ transporter-C (MgtC) family protein
MLERDLFGALEFEFVVAVGLSLIAGYITGLEREMKGKDAGVNTHMVVVMGSMLFTFLSGIVDPASKSRIAAQIVSGIGFLGAGLIIKEGITVKNLTTAASVWLASAIGMAIGYGYYAIALIATAAYVIVTFIPHPKARRNPGNNGADGPAEQNA